MNDAFRVQSKIKKHLLFWERKNNQPLIGFHIGNVYPVLDFNAAKSLLATRGPITPDMIEPLEFVEDYERLYQEHRKVSQDTFWAATPFPGFPWMEAILGCQIYSSANSFWASAHLSLEEVKKLKLSDSNPWFVKFIDFARLLVRISKGRFPVAQPFFRGPTDLLGTLRGQTQFVYDLYEGTQQLRETIDGIAKIYIQVVSKLNEVIPPFSRGYSIGFYDLWAPGRCIHFQEDLAALLSPDLYHKFFLPSARKISGSYPFSFIHLHPSSIFILDHLLTIQSLGVIQINRESTPDFKIKEMFPVFRKVQEAKKRLMISGELTREDIDQILSDIKPYGLYLQIVVPSSNSACKMHNYFKESWEKHKMH